jgi:hypothetical protein
MMPFPYKDMVWEYFLALGILAIGTFFDVFNKKMIPDIIWVSGLVIGVFGFLLTGSLVPSPAKLVELTAIFFVAFILTRRGWLGGADSQAIILLTFLLPIGDSLFILNNSALIAFITLPAYFILKRPRLPMKDWGNFPMPFILFMYLGTLAHVVIGNWFLKIII